MAQVTASVQVSFGASGTSDSGQSTLSAEVDSRTDGFNKGNTSFYPGDTVYILLFKGSKVGSVTQQASSGSVSQYTTTTVTRKESITYANSREFRTSVPISGSYSVTWYGQSHSLSKQGDNLLVASSEIVAAGEITYQASAVVYTLSGVEYPVAVVVFIGELSA